MFRSLKIFLGERIDYFNFLNKLQSLGYKYVDKVWQRGEYSKRGGIVDIYPPNYDAPLRIELNNDTIISLRAFNPLTSDVLEEHGLLIILPARIARIRRNKDFFYSEDFPLEGFLDVEEGDLVVHTKHGIGRYLGIKRVKENKKMRDYFLIEYADKDRLYVPVEDAHFLQRYIGVKGRSAKLTKLGTKEWERIKLRACRGIFNYAKELLEIQAKRTIARGYSYASDTEWQKILEEQFLYKETSDQIKAVKEVKKDLESSYPMDRLICGDVGYGKTEVALRAAFKVVMDNKQVAILVPTTILAEQHYRTFLTRMKDFPVRIEMLSRFKTQSEQKNILVDIYEGKVDIIIGTHRILSPDVKFKDLGLLIIDEEQRFGVEQKEKFKKFREEIDVLTLTATPIPRTLYMSLTGIRDISVINTPPEDRIPVEIYIQEFSEELIKRAIQKELKRNGQVYFVHNRINGIEKYASKIKKLLPQAKVAVAHGRLEEKILEEIMLEFLENKINVLVSTSIIQSGIDIPNANTIIINRADMFGLADLYQLKGRVGRYNKKAYAYFLIPKNLSLPRDAERRLKAIAGYRELGSGFKVAMEDLEIRGAGNILGVEQHGFITAIGFDLYCRLLRHAIYELKSQESKIGVGVN
jgi:transcription-repair coupling factor (superfamily II helicase)